MLLSRFGAWAVFLVLLGQPDLPQPAEFREHVIEAKIPGGYAVLVRDLNKTAAGCHRTHIAHYRTGLVSESGLAAPRPGRRNERPGEHGGS